MPEQYRKVHEALQQPEAPPKGMTLVVNIHSTRRDAITCRDSLIEFADKYGVAVLAPLFPAALDSPIDLDSYKNLRTKTLQSNLRLLDILNEVSHIWPGIATDSIVLMGFSGGAQFCHRFMYLHPERLSAVVVAAPGKITSLNNDAWPSGIGNVSEIFPDRKVDIPSIAQIKHIFLLVGESDEMSPETMELQAWLAERVAAFKGLGKGQTPEAPANGDRLQTLKSLQHTLEENGIECEVEIIPGAGHNYQALLPAMTSRLASLPFIDSGLSK